VTQNWYADGLLQSVNYAAGQTRNYAYDNADRVQTITNTVGSKSEQYSYGYDAHSNRINETLKVDGALSAIRTTSDLCLRSTRNKNFPSSGLTINSLDIVL
jgi:YD repeat-containing protein